MATQITLSQGKLFYGKNTDTRIRKYSVEMKKKKNTELNGVFNP